MRRRLALVAVAVTSLVVLAFVIPLALLVREQAEDRALSAAQRDSQSVAAALAVAGSLRPDQPPGVALAEAVIAAAGDPQRTTVFLANGQVAGNPVDDTTNVGRARAGTAFTALTEDGAEVLVPVRAADGTSVVLTRVPSGELRRGVTTAWLALGGLGAGMILAATFLADRLARSMVRPVGDLAAAAHELGSGHLATRVTPGGPPEVVEVGEAFNTLAGRLDELLAAERESVADLSHRLRTPLTALRLQAGTLADAEAGRDMLAEIDRLELGVTELITEARAPAGDGRATSADLAAVVRHRAGFWRVLAEEQQRRMDVLVPDQVVPVPMGPGDLGALLDALLGNVFTHTDSGTGFRVTVTHTNGDSALTVEDDGPGFRVAEPSERGTSGSGSTGLGLDIVARAARRTGGELELARSASGGARVSVRFGREAPA